MTRKKGEKEWWEGIKEQRDKEGKDKTQERGVWETKKGLKCE